MSFQMANKKLKILYITYEFGNHIGGGAGRVVNSVAKSLSYSSDIDVMLLRYNHLCYRFAIKLYKLNNGFHRIEVYGKHFKEFLIQVLQNKQYDLIHIFHCHLETKECVEIIKSEFPLIPIVYSCHSIVKYEIHTRKNDLKELSYERAILNNVDTIHLLNKTSVNYFKKAYPKIYLEKPVNIISNGIDYGNYQSVDIKFKNYINSLVKKGSIIVVCISRWTHGKGIEYLLDAIPAVIKQNQNITFLIAGRKVSSWENGFNEYTLMLDKKIEALNSNVFILGWLNDAKRNTLFSMANLVVMPSLLEYFPYSILEPAICNLPIISSKIKCVTEIFRDKEECLFYEPTDSKELMDQILLLANNKKLQTKLRNNASQKIKTEFNWNYISQQYLSMYNEVVAQVRMKYENTL